jgi:hypothetical protein
VEKIDLAFIGILLQYTVAVAVVIVIVTNRDSWMPIVRRIMSLPVGKGAAEKSNEIAANPAISLSETKSESAETARRIAEIRAESFTLGETEALARLVVAEKLGLTDAVKIGAEAKSGERYQRRSRDIKARAEAMRDKYPHMTPEQKRARDELGLPAR